MVSCDLALISDSLRDSVRERLSQMLPELDPMSACLNGTHTAPEVRMSGEKYGMDPGRVPAQVYEELGVPTPEGNVEFAAGRIAEAVAQAWQNREPGGISFGLAHAPVGYNRRNCYYSGETKMYGERDDPNFSHVEGGAETGVNVLCTWNRRQELTGVVVNLACPSQVSEQNFEVSADYWCETRRS